MKKILVVLLILAVGAGALFAQDAEAGTFTWSGEFRFGTELDLVPVDPTIKGNEGYGMGKVSYDKGALNTELEFKADQLNSMWGTVTGLAEYGDGVNSTESNFKVAGKLTLLASGGGMGGMGSMAQPWQTDAADAVGGPSVKPATLYAYYYFFDRQLKFDAAYNGPGTNYWRASDVIAGEWGNLDGKSGVDFNYTPTFLKGLSAGIYLPAWQDSVEWADDYLSKALFGAKYDIPHLLTVSAMVQSAPDKKQAAQLGFKYVAIPIASPDPIYTDDETLVIKFDAEASNLGDFGNTGLIRAGAKAEYIARPLTAGLQLKLDGAPGVYSDAMNAPYLAALWNAYEAQKSGGIEDYREYVKSVNGVVVGGPSKYDGAGGFAVDSDFQKLTKSYFYLKPYVYYDIIPYTLQARLPIELGISISDAVKDGMVLLVEPGLYWNFKHDKNVTGDIASGILAEYSLGYDLEAGDVIKNKLSLKFRWSF